MICLLFFSICTINENYILKYFNFTNFKFLMSNDYSKELPHLLSKI